MSGGGPTTMLMASVCSALIRVTTPWCSPMDYVQDDEREVACLLGARLAWVLPAAQEQASNHNASHWSSKKREARRDI